MKASTPLSPLSFAADTQVYAPLTSPTVVRRLLQDYGLQADKNFGQNFLVDANVLHSIVQAAQLSDKDTVLEIGPGLGVLTRELLSRAQNVTSIELDKRLIPLLRDTLPADNFQLVQGDALEFPLHTLPENSLLVANLPYNVATTLVMNCLESLRFKRLVFLVQKEVAERLVASAGDAAYGALSLLRHYFAEAKIIRHVKPSAFMPAPKVTSSVVRLVARANTTADPALFSLIKQGFSHRRKTLKKNLLMAGYEKERVISALVKVGVDEKVRAEEVWLEQFQNLKLALNDFL